MNKALVGGLTRTASNTRPPQGLSRTFKSGARFALPLLALLAAAMVAGCAGPTRTGATLDVLAKTTPPKGGQARIIVFRDKGFAGIIDAGWQVHVDGASMGDLKTGTFVYADRPAGHHRLTFMRGGDLIHVSIYEFDAAPARSYFFRIEMNEKGRMVAAMSQQAGLAGLFISSAVASAADDRGYFDFIPIDATVAPQTLADLHLAE